jgi:Fe-S-cluster containining protein
LTTFRCLDGCDYCCVWRDYPIKRNAMTFDLAARRYVPVYGKSLGKGGAGLMPWELPKIKKLIKQMGNRHDENGKPIEYKITPATGIGKKGAKSPEVILSYRLMGRNEDGNICPFLSTIEEDKRTENGALKCLIYEERPLECRAYPVEAVVTNKQGNRMVKIDDVCQWVVLRASKGDDWARKPFPSNAILGLDFGSMLRIQQGFYSGVDMKEMTYWRYASGVYNMSERPANPYTGWVEWAWD